METNEPLIEKLQVIIHWSVRILAILMVFAISIGYWLVGRLPHFDLEMAPDKRELQAQVNRNDKTSQAETPTDVSKA